MSVICPQISGLAEEKSSSQKPINALMITGGCCHDYARQKLILSRGISARANVKWTIVHQGGTKGNVKIPLYESKDWAKGYDVVLHNECFAHVTDKDWVDNILQPHKDGTPAVLIHCAMHCYRTKDNRWFDFCGMTSHNHGPHHAFRVENLKPDHFITKGLGDEWLTPKGELYNAAKIHETATPLAHARRRTDNKPQVCVWTNAYGENKTRVFATTIGHHNETMVDPQYLDVVTRGLLWAAGRDSDDAFQQTSSETDEKIKDLATIKPEPEPDAPPKN